jgi:ABC-type dipeptide/oligopeptide/nickel transport system permease subunit
MNMKRKARSNSVATGMQAKVLRKRRPLIETWRAFSRDPASLIAVSFLFSVAVVCLLAPYISPHNPFEAVAPRNAPPLTGNVLLGADADGRDVLSRLLWGGRVSLVMGTLPTILATIVSLFIGIAAGYIGGWLDQFIMRSLDIFFAFPLVLVAIVVAGILTPGMLTVMMAIFIALIPYIARLVRTTTLSVKTQPYIEAARAGGASEWMVIWSYVLPNTVAPVIVYATTLVGMMMVLGSALSFLGLGVQPPTADWGLMISEGRTVLRRAPHVTIFPGIMIVLVALAFGFVGDGLRDAMDPRLRSR